MNNNELNNINVINESVISYSKIKKILRLDNPIINFIFKVLFNTCKHIIFIPYYFFWIAAILPFKIFKTLFNSFFFGIIGVLILHFVIGLMWGVKQEEEVKLAEYLRKEAYQGGFFKHIINHPDAIKRRIQYLEEILRMDVVFGHKKHFNVIWPLAIEYSRCKDKESQARAIGLYKQMYAYDNKAYWDELARGYADFGDLKKAIEMCDWARIRFKDEHPYEKFFHIPNYNKMKKEYEQKLAERKNFNFDYDEYWSGSWDTYWFNKTGPTWNNIKIFLKDKWQNLKYFVGLEKK